MKPDKIVAVLVALFLAALYAWAQTSYVFPISDGQLQTPLDGGGFAITNLGTSTASNAAATYGQVTEGVSGLLSSTNTWTGPNTFNTAYILGTGTNAKTFTSSGPGAVVFAGSGTTVVITAVPSTATSAGTPGQVATDGSYFYFCTGTNTWRRAAISSW